ncbi:rhomboid-like protein [Mycobacterium sp.]|uniref:rhomboid-like protein n=1 Tax=Mycobacterium sp. TaxID=1785 RepID=UPI0025DD7474|nr:rhomboid-like protein [Mycobacterium sp.]
MTLLELLPASRRWATAAMSVRITAGYAVVLVAVSLWLSTLGQHARELVVSSMSTNLHNLSHGHLSTLVGSAFVDDGGDIYVWLPGLVCLLALGELIWRARGLVMAFAVGHIGATLLVAAGLVVALKAGWLPLSIARATDVGTSYGAVCVLGALTVSIPSRWRSAWVGWWLGIAVTAAVAADFNFTAVGHVLALLLGIGLSFRLPAAATWTPIRMALLSVGAAFGYLLLSGSSTVATAGGLAGMVIGLLGDRMGARSGMQPAASTEHR